MHSTVKTKSREVICTSFIISGCVYIDSHITESGLKFGCRLGSTNSSAGHHFQRLVSNWRVANNLFWAATCWIEILSSVHIDLMCHIISEYSNGLLKWILMRTEFYLKYFLKNNHQQHKISTCNKNEFENHVVYCRE